MRRTKIVCTIGPASNEPEVLLRLIQAGMDVARLNMSHGNADFHTQNIEAIRRASQQAGKAVALLFDLQGPKLRVGDMPGQGLLLEQGQQIRLTPTAGADGVAVQFAGLAAAVRPGMRILLDDGLLELAVVAVEGYDVVCRVVTGGLLKSNKGINLPDADLAIPAITTKDEEDVHFALAHEADWIALSFVRQAQEVERLKALIRDAAPGGRRVPVIAKIEKPQALNHIDEIVTVADGIMVARGDLGIETSPEAVPMMQKHIIAVCNRQGVPVITATQMLESMIRNPRPTRAEASDVANAILDGTDAIMLSGETAVGKYPVQTVETMVRIACEAERNQPQLHSLPDLGRDGSITEAVCYAAADMAHLLKPAAIIVPTVGGTTARTLSRFRPVRPIIATTPNPAVQRQLQLYWGVSTVPSRLAQTTDQVIDNSVEAVLRSGLIREGETVIITAGSASSAPGVTDLIKVHALARTLARGVGIGSQKTLGRVRRLRGPLAGNLRVDPDQIVVTDRLDPTFEEVVRQAAGLIIADRDPDVPGLAGGEWGRPVVIGVGEAIDDLADGQWVILNAELGLVLEYAGRAAD